MKIFFRTVALASTIVLMTGGAAIAADESPEKEQNAPGVVDKVERGVVKGAKAAGRGIEHAAEATARGVKRGTKAVAKGVKRGAAAVGRTAERVGEKVSGSGSPPQDPGKQESTAP